MKVVFKTIDPILAHTFRLPIAALMLTGLSMRMGQKESLKIARYGRKTIGLLAVAGILSYGIAVLFSLYAMYFAGITRAAVLSSWTPIFVMFAAAIFLKEKLTIKLGLGAFLCSAGTFLIMAFKA